MVINCILIDDEPLARKGLKEYINDVDFLHLAGEFESPLQATSILNNGDVQLLFLDIQMPKITGLEFLKTLSNTPPVIFTTAYQQYALEGFEVNALDYLVKPVAFERFLKAALKAKEYYMVRQRNMTRVSPGPEDHFFVKADNKLVKISFDDILFAEALQNYVAIYTRERKFLSYLTFKALEDYLPAGSFIKTHKSFIVSVAKIDSIDANDIRIGEHSIPISRNEKEMVLQQLLKNKFLKR